MMHHVLASRSPHLLTCMLLLKASENTSERRSLTRTTQLMLVQCYDKLCCAMLCYAMLCYAMLCYAMPSCGVLPHAMLYCAVLC